MPGANIKYTETISGNCYDNDIEVGGGSSCTMVAEPWWWLHGGCGGGRDSGVLMPVLTWRRGRRRSILGSLLAETAKKASFL